MSRKNTYFSRTSKSDSRNIETVNRPSGNSQLWSVSHRIDGGSAPPEDAPVTSVNLAAAGRHDAAANNYIQLLNKTLTTPSHNVTHLVQGVTLSIILNLVFHDSFHFIRKILVFPSQYTQI